MPVYTYRARDNSGKVMRGTLEAESRPDLIQRLHKLGYLTTQVGESRPTSDLDLGSILESWRGIGQEDLIVFYIEFANLIRAGVPLLVSLHTLTTQVASRKLGKTLEDISRAVEGGESFSGALEHYPAVFQKLFVSMVKAGEASGKLDTILSHYAVYCEHQAEMRQKILGAIFYPTILLCASIAVVLFIVSFLIPHFAAMFMRVGIPLPLPTLILYKIGMILKQFGLFLCLFFLTAFFGVRFYSSTPAGRLFLDQWALKYPVWGPLQRKVAISRFARTLGMLLASGVPILQCLEIVREVVGNEVLGRVIGQARLAVEKGMKISESLRVSGEFPLEVLQMVAVGEETGGVDEMLLKIADFYDRSIGYFLKKMTTVLEPLLLAVMGGVIGFIMASMLLPMFNMIQVLRR